MRYYSKNISLLVRSLAISLILFSNLVYSQQNQPQPSKQESVNQNSEPISETDKIKLDLSIRDMSSEIGELRREIVAVKQKVDQRPKDIWDKLTAISTLISGILVAVIGFYATQIYNRRQREAEESRKDRELAVLQVEAVEKFFPHLSSGDESKKEAAIQAIASLGNEALATKLALTFGGSGSTAALSRIATLPDSKVAKSAEAALGELFSSIRPSVVRIESANELRATGFFISDNGFVLTAAHVIDSLDASNIQIKMASGHTTRAIVWKTAPDLDLAILKAHTEEPVISLTINAVIDVVLGSQVIALGQSVAAGWLAVVGTIATFDIENKNSNLSAIGVDMKIVPGFSGAPVLDSHGSFIGIVRSYIPKSNLTVITPASIVKSALNDELSDRA